MLGLLLGMHCTRPYQVPVPLRAPLDSASIFDTDCSAYVSRCISSGWRLSHFDRAHVDKFPPDSDYFLPNAYTFFYCDTSSAVAQNRSVKSSFSVANVHSLQWFGNILVLKHNDHYPTGGHGIVDVHPQEYWLLEEIIEWCALLACICLLLTAFLGLSLFDSIVGLVNTVGVRLSPCSPCTLSLLRHVQYLARRTRRC